MFRALGLIFFALLLSLSRQAFISCGSVFCFVVVVVKFTFFYITILSVHIYLCCWEWSHGSCIWTTRTRQITPSHDSTYCLSHPTVLAAFRLYRQFYTVYVFPRVKPYFFLFVTRRSFLLGFFCCSRRFFYRGYFTSKIIWCANTFFWCSGINVQVFVVSFISLCEWRFYAKINCFK